LKQAVYISNWNTPSNMSPELFVSLAVQLFNPFIMFWSPLQRDNFKIELFHAVIANIRFVNEISEGTLLHLSMAMTCSIPSLRVDKIVVLIKRFLQVWLRFFTKELLWEEEG
jgi:hypothetical protein